MKKFIILFSIFCLSALSLIALLLGYAISGHQMVTDFNQWIVFSGLLGFYGLDIVVVVTSLGLLVKELLDEKKLLTVSK